VIINIPHIADNSHRKDYKYWIKAQRYTEILIVFIMVQKAFSFMSLNDNISPLIDIIYKVFRDIIYFCIVLLIVMFAMSICFYLISHNQIDFDEIPVKD